MRFDGDAAVGKRLMVWLRMAAMNLNELDDGDGDYDDDNDDDGIN